MDSFESIYNWQFTYNFTVPQALLNHRTNTCSCFYTSSPVLMALLLTIVGLDSEFTYVGTYVGLSQTVWRVSCRGLLFCLEIGFRIFSVHLSGGAEEGDRGDRQRAEGQRTRRNVGVAVDVRSFLKIYLFSSSLFLFCKSFRNMYLQWVFLINAKKL
jgi:hypothetical protein